MLSFLTVGSVKFRDIAISLIRKTLAVMGYTANHTSIDNLRGDRNIAVLRGFYSVVPHTADDALLNIFEMYPKLALITMDKPVPTGANSLIYFVGILATFAMLPSLSAGSMAPMVMYMAKMIAIRACMLEEADADKQSNLQVRHVSLHIHSKFVAPQIVGGEYLKPAACFKATSAIGNSSLRYRACLLNKALIVPWANSPYSIHLHH